MHLNQLTVSPLEFKKLIKADEVNISLAKRNGTPWYCVRHGTLISSKWLNSEHWLGNRYLQVVASGQVLVFAADAGFHRSPLWKARSSECALPPVSFKISMLLFLKRKTSLLVCKLKTMRLGPFISQVRWGNILLKMMYHYLVVAQLYRKDSALHGWWKGKDQEYMFTGWISSVDFPEAPLLFLPPSQSSLILSQMLYTIQIPVTIICNS